MAGLKAAMRQWPEILTPEAVAPRREELLQKMREVRPVIETGYENVVQVRCLWEGMTSSHMLDHWGHEELPAAMGKWNLDRSELVKLFGAVRDEWIAEDLDSWLAPNNIYPGVADLVRTALEQQELYIVTTKQAHYTELLLHNMAGVPVPMERIFSQTVSGRPKSEVLHALEARHPDAARKLFVEDKLSTLEKVALLPDCQSWELYLVDWGYNTPAERLRAATNPRIQVISVAEFQAVLTAVCKQ
ncbi:MAG: hypothetical protein WDW38_005882 [Sanguina aurantia]